MATKTKKLKTKKKTGRGHAAYGAKEKVEARAEYEEKLMVKRGTVDPRMPAAWGVRPLMRLRLANPATYIGHILIDVVAITEGRDGRDTYHCLSYMDHDGSWVTSHYYGSDLIDIMEHYEVVS